MTPDRHIVFKAQFKTPGVAARRGAPGLRHWVNCGSSGREGWAGITQPISRDQLTQAPSLKSEENKHIYKVN